MSDRVLLGFSGGMDSCHSVTLLREEGYEPVAVVLDMGCCAGMVEKAVATAAEMGAECIVRDVRSAFEREVVDYFCTEYLRGRTPAPCTVCNVAVKWASLLSIADCQGVRHIATGHYFGVETIDGKYFVAKADDPIKDQSYYLWALSQQVLSRVLTPMRHVLKSQIRASHLDKRESMGVCFLNGRPYSEFIAARCGRQPEGAVVDVEGKAVGRHSGIANYTIGQRRGEGIPAGCCVVAIDAPTNRLVVGRQQDLYHSWLEISGCNVVDDEELFASTSVEVKVRGLGRNPEGSAVVTRGDEGRLIIELSDPAWALSVGQPVVMYIGERVVGGGILERYEF